MPRDLEKYIEAARDLYCTDDIEIDDLDVKTSEAGEGGDAGVWVAAWLWVSDEDLAGGSTSAGEQAI